VDGPAGQPPGAASEMGMVVVSSTVAVGPTGRSLSAEGDPLAGAARRRARAFPRFAAALIWWVIGEAQRQHKPPC